MNDTHITIRGWVGNDVQLTVLPSGTPVAQFRMASTRRRFNRQTNAWEDGETLWFTVKAWRALGENVARSVQARQAVLVHGRLEAETWTKEDGTTQVAYVVVATSVGHDLARGTATFHKTERPVQQDENREPAPAAVEDPSAWEVRKEPAA